MAVVALQPQFGKCTMVFEFSTLLVITRVCYACRVVVAVMRSLYQKLDAVQTLKFVCTQHKQHARIR
eukprot:16184-Heterococcus_DN1.PRE.7